MTAGSALSCSSGAVPGATPSEEATVDSSVEESAPPSKNDPRPFALPRADDPGGPAHTETVPAEPSTEELSEAAAGPADRYGAEVFALTMSHAVEDQTAGLGQEVFEQHLAADIPEEALKVISVSRRFPGNRTAPGERAWVRSQESPSGAFVVHLVELVESPFLGDAEDDPYYFWSANLVTVAQGEDGWELVDFQQRLAFESRDFSPEAWKSDMDSGKGWRSVSIA